MLLEFVRIKVNLEQVVIDIHTTKEGMKMEWMMKKRKKN